LPDLVVVRIAHVQLVSGGFQSLGEAEGRLRKGSVPVAGRSPADDAPHFGAVAGELQLQDAVVMGIGDEEVAGFRVDGQFSGKGEGAVRQGRPPDLNLLLGEYAL